VWGGGEINNIFLFKTNICGGGGGAGIYRYVHI